MLICSLPAWCARSLGSAPATCRRRSTIFLRARARSSSPRILKPRHRAPRPRLHRLKLGGRLVLVEAELAAINMALGASFGGTPAMTVTSGPGLSLMVETLGLAVAAEIPVVLIDVMRAGPST